MNKTIQHDWNIITSKHPQRSLMNLSTSIKTTLNTGQLIPLHFEELIPGDLVKLNLKAMLRQTTLIKPTMDNARIDMTAFQVPWRIIWEQTAQFFGENTDEWAENELPTIPQIKAPQGGWSEGTIADYLGIPPGVEIEVNALIFRAYTKIVNDWYRDQNLQKASLINLGGNTMEGSNGDQYVTDLEKGGKPFNLAKLHDYFTSCLPDPQKGQAISINVGGQAPLKGTGKFEWLKKADRYDIKSNGEKTLAPLMGVDTGNNGVSLTGSQTYEGGTLQGDTSKQLRSQIAINNDNVFADLSLATGITINQLRESITLQQMLELDARGGTRYTEYLANHFGVNNNDGRLQRSEFLGGYTEQLGTQQIPQMVNSEDEPLANLGAYGETRMDQKGIINKTITEHSYLIILASIRYEHTYQQGLHPAWSIKDKFDLYDPIFANLGEQAVYKREIMVTKENNTNEEVFGYQEAWARYKQGMNRTSGKMRSSTKDSLDVWHYGDFYKEVPSLSGEWIKEDASNVDRTLAFKSTGENAQPQFFGDFWLGLLIERPIPALGEPGLKRI